MSRAPAAPASSGASHERAVAAPPGGRGLDGANAAPSTESSVGWSHTRSSGSGSGPRADPGRSSSGSSSRPRRPGPSSVLVEGLVVVAVAWPHRRASVPTTVRATVAGRRAPRAGVRPGSFRRLFAVLRPIPDARDWVALTDEPLPTADRGRVGDRSVGRRGRDLHRGRPRSRRGPPRRRGHDLRGLRGPGRAGARRHRRRDPPPLARRRADRAAAPRRRAAALRGVGRGRGLGAAPRRRVRRGRVRDRHAEGVGADLEAGALGGRLRLGRRAARDPSARRPASGRVGDRSAEWHSS